MKKIKLPILASSLVATSVHADPSLIDLVKSTKLALCPNANIEQMVTAYMQSPALTEVPSDNGTGYVNIAGGITYLNKPIQAVIQFSVTPNTRYVMYNALEFNGIPQNQVMATGLLSNMCVAAMAGSQKVAQALQHQPQEQEAPTSTAIINEAEEKYGKYENSQAVITYDMTDSGGDVFYSSLCKEAFRPVYDGDSGMFSGEAGDYVISILGEPLHMEIESSNKCLPEGKYKKVE